MSKKKPILTAKQERLTTAKRELDGETDKIAKKVVTILVEETLLFAIQEVALQRKKRGITPHTVAGIARQAFQDYAMKD